MKKKLQNILPFLILFLLVNLVIQYFWGNNDQNTQEEKIVIEMQKEFQQGDNVQAEIKNNTTQTAIIQNDCPEEPLDVLKYINGEWQQISKKTSIPCESTDNILIQPGGKHTFNYAFWNHALFGDTGRYKLKTNVELQGENGKQSQTLESVEFEVKSQGIFSYLWTTLFYQPIYNVLIFLISIAPGKDLSLAIILLTLIIRTILLVPSQRALKSQRRMQELQPKLNRIREKYKDNQEMMAKETMAIWKEHKVNPMGSCLPLLIQFPILIALFYVIQDGLNPDKGYLLYNGLKTFTFDNINTYFLGTLGFTFLDLTKINYIALPLIVGGLQFLQMKLALVQNKKKKEQKGNQKKEKNEKPLGSEMEMATSMMTYIMPVMIAFFTASVPAGVGVYWAISTLYGIGQQLVVNRQVKVKKDE